MIFITVHSHILVDYFLSCMKMNEKRAIMEYYTFLQLLSNFVILFFAFSVLGWITEVTLKFIQFHRFINRGFFIGPYCPIYGWGAVAITVLVGGLLGREGTVGETFLARDVCMRCSGILYQLVHGENVPCQMVGLQHKAHESPWPYLGREPDPIRHRFCCYYQDH